jgi:tetratricopeptide (TPR) repeat protein
MPPGHTKEVTKVRPKAAEHAAPSLPAHAWWPDVWLCLLLLAATLAVYSQVRHYDFVNYDDPQYITNNLHVRAGLTAAGAAWALTSFEAANWIPLTWLTHMADCQFFGMDAGWHHLTNLWLHALSALLLFAVLKRMTGARWPSAAVAFLFALHPLHVESVAWVAERKDVLSAFFWMLTLACYVRYVERPGVGRYLTVLLAFLLGLMAKPMVVTLPFVLLLLDVWPLRRNARLWPGKAQLLEKLPLFAMAAVASAVTFLAQRYGGAVAPLAGIPLPLRLENALVSYLLYIRDLFWPAGLAVLYPQTPSLPAIEVLAAIVVLGGISMLVVWQFRARPYLAVGWCWYLGTLVPVIGLVQVGSQSRADRYTYIPMVGLSLMLAWAAAELVERWPRARLAMLAGAGLAMAAMVAVAWFQIQYWANSETLIRRALAVTSGNFIMHNNLSDYYLGQKRNDEARVEAAAALAIDPNYLEAHLHLATALNRLGNPQDAETEYRRALELRPQGELLFEAHSGLSEVLAAQQRADEALLQAQLAVQAEPDNLDGRFNLGTALAAMGRNQEASGEFAAVVRSQPDDADAHHRLAMTLAAQGKWSEAAVELGAEAQLHPDDALLQYNLGVTFTRMGHLDDAIAHFSEALRIKPDFQAARNDLQRATAERDAKR